MFDKTSKVNKVNIDEKYVKSEEIIKGISYHSKKSLELSKLLQSKSIFDHESSEKLQESGIEKDKILFEHALNLHLRNFFVGPNGLFKSAKSLVKFVEDNSTKLKHMILDDYHYVFEKKTLYQVINSILSGKCGMRYGYLCLLNRICSMKNIYPQGGEDRNDFYEIIIVSHSLLFNPEGGLIKNKIRSIYGAKTTLKDILNKNITS